MFYGGERYRNLFEEIHRNRERFDNHQREWGYCKDNSRFIQLEFERLSSQLGFSVFLLRESFYKKFQMIKCGLPLCRCSNRDKDINEAMFIRLDDVIATLEFIGEVLPYKDNRYYVYDEKYIDELKKYSNTGPVFRVVFKSENHAMHSNFLSGIWIGNHNNKSDITFLKLILI